MATQVGLSLSFPCFTQLTRSVQGWEILLHLRAFFKSMDDKDQASLNKARRDHVFGMNFPYYLREDRVINPK